MSSTKREKELARQRAERQAARDAAAGQRRRQRNAVLGSVVAVALAAGAAVAGSQFLGGSDAPSDSVAAAVETTTTPRAAPPASPSAVPSATKAAVAGDPGCTYEKTPEPAARQVLLPPTEGVETEEVYEVTVATDRGDIVFEMDSATTPCTANNLRSLAHFRYFDGTACHRLTTEGIEVLQCGDPTGTGSGGPGYQFADENLEDATYPRGTVAMANAGPGTNGSQFFLVFRDSQLPPNYTVFGTIDETGLATLDKIAAEGTVDGGPDGPPKMDVNVKSIALD